MSDVLADMRARHHREERALVRSAMIEADWVASEAARALGCPASTLQRRLRAHPKLLRMARIKRGLE